MHANDWAPRIVSVLKKSRISNIDTYALIRTIKFRIIAVALAVDIARRVMAETRLERRGE